MAYVIFHFSLLISKESLLATQQLGTLGIMYAAVYDCFQIF